MEKHPIRPINKAAIIGITYKSPEAIFTPMIFLMISTPNNPPRNPPATVLF
jgi:hypothetical protein